MPQFIFAGEQRVKLRNAIVDGFNSTSLALVLRDNNFDTNSITFGSDFTAKVDNLIETARQEGWLVQLCVALAKRREDNNIIRDPILQVHRWLVDAIQRVQSSNEPDADMTAPPKAWSAQNLLNLDPIKAAPLKARSDTQGPGSPKISVVFSSVGTDAAWTNNFQNIGGFIDALQPCDIVDTLARFKQSKDNVRNILRDIEDANVFVAFLSRRYIAFRQTADEIQTGLDSLRRTAGTAGSHRKLLAVVLDQESSDWLDRKEAQDLIDKELLIKSNFFEGKDRKAIVAEKVVDDSVAEQIVNLGEGLRCYFDDLLRLTPVKPSGSSISPFMIQGIVPTNVAPPGEPSGPPVPASSKIVILGEPKNASVPEAVTAVNELVQELVIRNVPHQRWEDGWREVVQPLKHLEDRPLFVRTVVDQKQTNPADILSRLSSELNVSFGFQFDDEGEKVQAVTVRPKVLWRPNGPNWTPAAIGPLLFSSGDRPIEFARWLALQLGIDVATSNAIVHYEDPVDKGDVDNPRRREAVEESLRAAIANGEPPLFPDSLPFGYQQLQEVIDSILLEPNKLTVLAAHDMRSKVGSHDDTLQRFRDIDRHIEESLARKSAENAPLMRVAVLLRNWQLFPALEFSRNSRVNKWQLLRISKRSDGTLVPDVANVERLREYAANLISQCKSTAP